MSRSTLTQDSLVIERTFNAPVQLLWQLWTEPEHFKQWYGPQGFSVPVAKMDVRVGGERIVCMEGQTPRGNMTIWTAGEHLVVNPQQHLVYTESMADEDGNILPSAATADQALPTSSEVSVHLKAHGEQTHMTLKHTGVPGNQQGATSGWQQAFDKMTAIIAKTE